MELNPWIDQMYTDSSLSSELEPQDTEQLHSWAEAHLAACDSERDAMRLFDSMRLLNRYVKEGEPFEQLFAALRANNLRTEGRAVVPQRPDEMNPEMDAVYPPESE